MVPLSEVMIVPDEPTDTNLLFAYMTSLRWFVVPEFVDVHVVPLSKELRMVPDVPTDRNLLFAKVTPQRLLDVEV